MNDNSTMMADRWCILRTSGARTLSLADALVKGGFVAWSPRRTFKRERHQVRRGLRVPLPAIEVDAPILPSFVFAGAGNIAALAAAAADPVSALPKFSIFTHGGRVPLIGSVAIEGLRAEERSAVEQIEAIRNEDRRQAERQARVAALRTERERRKALRAEYREFMPGQEVEVSDMPSMAGMTGVVSKSDGRSAIVGFGGSLIIEIEAWRLTAVELSSISLDAA